MKYFILSLLSLLLFNCNSSKPLKQTVQKNTKVNYKIVAQSALHGNGAEQIKPGSYIIKDQKSWQDLLKKMDRVNNESSKFAINEIDFDKSMIVAVFDPVMGSGGVKLKVNQVKETEDMLIVSVGHKHPQEQLSIMVMNQPYLILMLPKTDKKIKVEIEK